MDRKLCRVAAALLVFSGAVAAQEAAPALPDYDIVTYCESISGGSYEVESFCMDEEERARLDLEGMEIEERIVDYCAGIAGFGGGSYSTLQFCVEEEQRARAGRGDQAEQSVVQLNSGGAGATSSAASAAGACDVEDWRWYTAADYLTIEGATTCASGEIVIRLYEGEGEAARFLGVADAFIEGYTFTAIAQGISPPPQSVSIKYAIEPGG